MQSVDASEAAMALFVNATRPDEVMQVALAGQQMPQKGTYFYPKLLSGTVLYDLQAEQ